MSIQSISRAAVLRVASSLRQIQRKVPHELVSALPANARRTKSSSASILDFPVPDTVRQAVKSSLLNEATKSNSSLWSQPVNGKHPPPHRRQQSLQQQQHPDINSSSFPEDPLEDWHLDRTTRYWPSLPPGVSQGVDPFLLAQSEIQTLSQTIQRDLLGTDHPVLNQAASYFFDSADGGKKVRPMMVLLLSRALSETLVPSSKLASSSSSLLSTPLTWQRGDLPQAQRRLAEITEMIHTASLFHDDVIDGSDTRRNQPAVHKVFGNKMAILAGDYLLARASISLARLSNVQVVECMSTIIEHLVRGEVMQLKNNTASSTVENDAMDYYLRKTFFKTASLMANSCKSTALLGGYPQELVDACYDYGKHVGMAFQLVDDVLDFEGSATLMGKPALADLHAGLVTAPILFASQQRPELVGLMKRKFKYDGDVQHTVTLLEQTDGVERTKQLARVHAELAMEAVMLTLKDSTHRDALVHLAYKVVDRTR